MLLLPSQIGSIAPGTLASQAVSDPSNAVFLASFLTAEEQILRYVPGFLWAKKEQCAEMPHTFLVLMPTMSEVATLNVPNYTEKSFLTLTHPLFHFNSGLHFGLRGLEREGG